MIREHDPIILCCDLPEEGLKQGDIGTVVHITKGHDAYVVEFVTPDGETVAVEILEARQVRPIGPGEMQHARALESRA
jgi:ATP-dependent exoDNAse (exonuclease V) alpha subunit